MKPSVDLAVTWLCKLLFVKEKIKCITICVVLNVIFIWWDCFSFIGLENSMQHLMFISEAFLAISTLTS